MKRVMAVLLAAVLSMNAGSVGALELTEEEREQKLKYEEEIRQCGKIRDEIEEEYTYDDFRSVYVYSSPEYTRVMVCVWEDTAQNLIDGLQVKYGDNIMVTDLTARGLRNSAPIIDARDLSHAVSYYPDVDGDGEISLSDIQMILQSYMGMKTLNMRQANVANVNDKGAGADDDVVIDLNDVQTALNMYMGLQYMYEPDN